MHVAWTSYHSPSAGGDWAGGAAACGGSALLAATSGFIDPELLADITERIRQADRPLLLLGGGLSRAVCQKLQPWLQALELPLLKPSDPTQTQSYLPIIPGVFSTVRAWRKI